MVGIDASLLEELRGARLGLARGWSRGHFGDRASAEPGAGIEFMDYRPYAIGDDFRHFDLNVYSRLGQMVVRQYEASRQLSVGVLLDVSGSMQFGAPLSKLEKGIELGNVIRHIATEAGDRCLLGAMEAGSVVWGQLDVAAVNSSGSQSAQEETDLKSSILEALGRLQEADLLFVISDWLSPSAPTALDLIAGHGIDFVTFHVQAREEVEPWHIGRGRTVLFDAETRQKREVDLNEPTFEAYLANYMSWAEAIRETVWAGGGRYLLVRSDNDLRMLVRNEWRALGIIE